MVPLMVVEWLLNNPCSCRRADGTLRKERKVKPGYIPQDEQPMYVSRGSMVCAPGQLSPSGALKCAPLYPLQPVQAKQNVPKCPGMPEADAAAPKLSKTARKNAKRKEQRQAAAEGTGGDSSGSAADGAAEQLQHLRWGTVAGVLHAASISGHEAEGNCPACLHALLSCLHCKASSSRATLPPWQSKSPHDAMLCCCCPARDRLPSLPTQGAMWIYRAAIGLQAERHQRFSRTFRQEAGSQLPHCQPSDPAAGSSCSHTVSPRPGGAPWL